MLAALEEFGPASQASLGRHAELDRSDVTAVVSELTAQDLVLPDKDQTDGRRNVITITAAGRKQLRRLDAVLAEVQDELLAPLSPGERQFLTSALVRVLDHLAAGSPALDVGEADHRSRAFGVKPPSATRNC